MSLTPGGRRSPTASPPDRPRDGKTPAWSGSAAGIVLRWGFLIGGLVIIADLATRAAQQRVAGAEMVDALEILDLIANAILFSIAGASVARKTGRVLLGALTGLVAGLVDGIVVGAAISMAPLPATAVVTSAEQVWLEIILFNVTQGTVLATVSAWFGRMARQRSGS